MAVEIAAPDVRVEPGVAWVRFQPLGQIAVPGGIELVGKMPCAFCGREPMTVSATPGRWETVYCPSCCGEHRVQPAGNVPARLGEVA